MTDAQTPPERNRAGTEQLAYARSGFRKHLIVLQTGRGRMSGFTCLWEVPQADTGYSKMRY